MKKFLLTLIVMTIIAVSPAYAAQRLSDDPEDTRIEYDKEDDLWIGGDEMLCRYHKGWGTEPDNKQYNRIEVIHNNSLGDERAVHLIQSAHHLTHSKMKNIVNGELLKKKTFVASMTIKIDHIKIIGPRKLLLIGEFGTYNEFSELSQMFPCEIEVYVLNNNQKKFIFQQIGKLFSYVNAFVKKASKDKVIFEYGLVIVDRHCMGGGHKWLFGRN